jgi:hypothetical protein
MDTQQVYTKGYCAGANSKLEEMADLQLRYDKLLQDHTKLQRKCLSEFGWTETDGSEQERK